MDVFESVFSLKLKLLNRNSLRPPLPQNKDPSVLRSSCMSLINKLNPSEKVFML